MKLSAFLLCITFFIPAVCISGERHGMQDNPGFCQGFRWGGQKVINKIRLHYYTCCNNWDEAQPPTCDKDTYQTASTGKYCGSKGANSGKGKRFHKKFKCGGCAGQSEVAERCKKKYPNIPGFCWKFTGCMEKNCKFWYSEAMSYGMPMEEFIKSNYSSFDCGDGICSAPETPDNCPLDCCQLINPQVCKAPTNACTPECCGDSGCCLFNDSNPPIGSVIDWWQPQKTNILPIPFGYEVCDGTNITTPGSLLYGQIKPDLRNLFIMGIGNVTEIGKEGGSSLTHTSNSGSHAHTVGNGQDEGGNICGSCSHCSKSLIGCGHNTFDPPASTQKSGIHTHTVNTIPPYMTLLKLLKVL